MPLTKRERKDRLGRGGQKRIALKAGVSETTVSQVLNRKTQSLARETIRKVQAVAAEEIGAAVEEIFGDAAA